MPDFLVAAIAGLRRLAALVWALPTTCVGLLPMGVALATRGTVRRVTGVLEIQGAYGFARALGGRPAVPDPLVR